MGWHKILLATVLVILACKSVDCGGHGLRIEQGSRPPLGPGAQFMVVFAAILIILANAMLCTFIIRDSNLWSFVSNSHLSIADTPN